MPAHLKAPLIALAASIVVSLAFAAARGTYPVALLTILAAITFGAFYTPGMALVSDRTEAVGLSQAIGFGIMNTAWALGNLLEYPVWLIAGFLVPLTLLPGWVRPISWLLAPTWGVDAIRDAASGSSAWPEIALALGLGAVYLTIGIAVLETVLASARRAGSLALA